ncbi:hypothetical protein GMMP15_660051 [Candidatus Magnetomoraceae bacterium gMMP-15]
MKINYIILVIFIILLVSDLGYSYASDAISDREIIERLTRLEEGQKAILREMDKRFEAMDKRFERMLQEMNNRFEAVDNRFDQFNNLVIGIICAFTALVAAIIGFAIWDRRSMIARAREEAEKICIKNEERDQSIALKSYTALQTVIDVLRKWSEKQPDMRKILQDARLL